ncbi:MAG: recombination mediator RecR [Phycisphaerales bacterium JB063]
MPTPSAYDNLLDQLEKLPGIGRRSAERIAFHLLRQPAESSVALAQALEAFRTNLRVCGVCGHVSESDPCPICADDQRDASVVLVVEQPSDVFAIEQAGSYRGRYHVLMGRLAPMEAIGPGDLNIQPLLQRVRASRPAHREAQPGEPAAIREVILGTNPTLEGDGTALYLSEKLRELGVNVTRLARGMPTGSSLQGVSKAVLSDAVQGRTRMDDH